MKDLNTVIMDMVGPHGWRDMGIVAATLDLAAGQPPQLTLNCQAMGGVDHDQAQQVRRLFTLQPVDQPAPALDLDAMVKAATERIGRHIHKVAETASAEVKHAFQLARGRAVERHKDAWQKHGDIALRFYMKRLAGWRAGFASGGAAPGQVCLMGEGA